MLRWVRFVAIRAVLIAGWIFAPYGGSATSEEGAQATREANLEDSSIIARPNKAGDVKDVTIVVANQLYSGDLIPPATEDGFRFRWKEKGHILLFRWTSLEESEQNRIRGLLGVKVVDPQYGEDVECVRLTLVKNRQIEGKLEPERAIKGHYCVRTARQVLQIPQKDVLTLENITKRESDIYLPEEVLQRILLRSPPRPDSAADQLNMARMCARLGLYKQAVQYLDRARVLDDRTAISAKDFRQELLTQYHEDQARKLYEQIVMAIHREQYRSAKKRCEKYLQRYPSGEGRTKVEKLMIEVTLKSEGEVAGQVIGMYYDLMPKLIAARMAKKIKVDEKGLPVPAIPGKQIETRTGNIVRGLLRTGENPNSVYVQRGHQTIEIPRNNILVMKDVDISKGVKMVLPPFTQLKDYVTDREGGLGGDLAVRIADALGIPATEVRNAWQNRFAQSVVLKDAVLEKSPVHFQTKRAYYHTGSWLRPDSKAKPVTIAEDQRLSNLERKQVEKLLKELPGFSSDPDIWWEVQSHNTQFAILCALAAEHLCQVKEIQRQVCPECAGRGHAFVQTSRKPIKVICNSCRGAKELVVVIYE